MGNNARKKAKSEINNRRRAALAESAAVADHLRRNDPRVYDAIEGGHEIGPVHIEDHLYMVAEFGGVYMIMEGA